MQAAMQGTRTNARAMQGQCKPMQGNARKLFRPMQGARRAPIRGPARTRPFLALFGADKGHDADDAGSRSAPARSRRRRQKIGPTPARRQVAATTMPATPKRCAPTGPRLSRKLQAAPKRRRLPRLRQHRQIGAQCADWSRPPRCRQKIGACTLANTDEIVYTCIVGE